MIERGATLRAAAAALNVAPATAHRWWHRWRQASRGGARVAGVLADAAAACRGRCPWALSAEDERAILTRAREDQLGADAADVSDRSASLDDLEGPRAPRRARAAPQSSARRPAAAMSGPRPGRCCISTRFEVPKFDRPGHWAHGERSEPHKTRHAGKIKVIGVIDDHTRLVYCEIHAAENATTVSATLQPRRGMVPPAGLRTARRPSCPTTPSATPQLSVPRHARRTRGPPHPHPAPHPALEREDRAVLRHPRTRMGARPRLAQHHPTRPCPVIVHPLLQPPPTPHSLRRPTAHHPRSATPRAGQLERRLRQHDRGRAPALRRQPKAAAAARRGAAAAVAVPLEEADRPLAAAHVPTSNCAKPRAPTPPSVRRLYPAPAPQATRGAPDRYILDPLDPHHPDQLAAVREPPQLHSRRPRPPAPPSPCRAPASGPPGSRAYTTAAALRSRHRRQLVVATAPQHRRRPPLCSSLQQDTPCTVPAPSHSSSSSPPPPSSCRARPQAARPRERAATARLAPPPRPPRRPTKPRIAPHRGPPAARAGRSRTIRVTVGPPAHERRVPEARALHVVVADLEHALRPERHQRERFAGVPAAPEARRGRSARAPSSTDGPRTSTPEAAAPRTAPAAGPSGTPDTPTERSPPSFHPGTG